MRFVAPELDIVGFQMLSTLAEHLRFASYALGLSEFEIEALHRTSCLVVL